MVGNKPSFTELVQWAYDYNVVSFDAVNFLETYTFKVNGTYNTTTGAYTGGTIVGYLYIKYSDAIKTNYVSAYGKKA